MSENNKWTEEQDRVDFVLDTIKTKQRILQESSSDLKKDIIHFRKSFWDDVTVNIDDPDDIIETQASIKQQAEFLSERERSHGQQSEKLKTLLRLEDSPYFGRIDFQENGETNTEVAYIGIASLMDKKEEDFLIYDWRAPISSMYYNYSPGPAEFETMDGSIEGEMTLKRQFIIRNSEIKGLFDTGITIGDRLLQNLLGSHSSPQMKTIVSTIQKEQNQIIRNERSRYLVVQGVAGSGKTSAALQRVAYLLYAHRESLTAENMVLFSPNPLFNSYVATVLPELGEENMWQTTFNEYVQKELGETFDVEDPFEQMEWFLESDDSTQDEERNTAVQMKSSLSFKNQIDEFVSKLEHGGLHFQNIRFRKETLVSANEISAYFYGLDSAISIPNRMELTSEWLLQQIKAVQRSEWKKPWVEEAIQLLDKEEYLEGFNKLEKNKRFTEDTFDDFDREEEWLSKRVVKKQLAPLKRKIKNLAFVNVVKTYREFYYYLKTDVQTDNAEWHNICNEAINSLQNKKLTWEEATPYLYLQDKIKGRRPLTHIRHVFIDEAQDYSPFQFAYLKQLFPQARMTLLGDVHQSIYLHTLTNSSPLDETNEDSTSNTERITLMRSYRSTAPIVTFTSQLIEGGDEIIPFNRDGKKPVYIETTSKEEMNNKIQVLITSCTENNMETVAVICKTINESRAVHDILAQHTSAQLIDKETYTYKKGLVVIPSYLAKGIEFDTVILYDASKDHYHKESERNLFYTVCTRAMHELYLVSSGEKSPFIDQAKADTYEIKE
ncbi:RNA polymerase recycling motor HelD [Alteribacter populi]|uniref:RNA polymerase recycling motor HelD n=1 Tax=Alteribacter populi TaxID=2011011 RepID=UPI000BBB13C0|nr:RNA polymerase recycling motor HelD [Alteribacter populi]